MVQQVNSLVNEMKDDLLRATGDERDSIGDAMGYMASAAALGYAGAYEANQDSQEAREALVKMVLHPLQSAASGAASGAGGPAAGLLADQLTGAGTETLVDFLNSGLEEEQQELIQLKDNVINNVLYGVPSEYRTALNATIGRMLGVAGLPGE